MVEAVTDPAGLGWVDGSRTDSSTFNTGEVADICNGGPANPAHDPSIAFMPFFMFHVSRYWSNKDTACMPNFDSLPPPVQFGTPVISQSALLPVPNTNFAITGSGLGEAPIVCLSLLGSSSCLSSFLNTPQLVPNVRVIDLTMAPPTTFGSSLDAGGTEGGLIYSSWTPTEMNVSVEGVPLTNEFLVNIWDLGTGQTCGALCPAPSTLGSCTLAAQNEAINYAAPTLGVAEEISLSLTDQFGKLFTVPSMVTYTSPLPNTPTDARSITTGIDSFSSTVTVPNAYPLTATVTNTPPAGSTVAATTVVTCSLTLSVAPILSTASSSMRAPALGGYLPLVSTNGVTTLTLSGLGFTEANSATIGTVSFSGPQLKVNSDTSITLQAQNLGQLGTNPGAEPVTVKVNGIQSNAVSVYLLTPGAPVVQAALNFPPSQSCLSAPTGGEFTIWASVYDVALNPIPNATMSVTADYRSGMLTTNGSGSPGFFGAAWNDAFVLGGNPYLAAVTYQGITTQAYLKTTSSSNPTKCAVPSRALIVGDSGRTIQGKTTCYSCSIRDLSLDDARNSYIDDLVAMGAISVGGPSIFPQRAVTLSEFVGALRKVLRGDIGARLLDIGSPAMAGKVLTREDAARLVASLVAISGASHSNTDLTSVLVKQHFLTPVAGKASGDQKLTRIEMINLLWHLAAKPLQPTSL